MIKLSSMMLAAIVTAAALLPTGVAFSQTSIVPKSRPGSGTSGIPAPNGALLVPAQTAPSATPPATPAETPLILTDAQATAWIDKAIYSSDDKKIGEVAAFARDGTGKVTEMHADIGGFLGMGETRIRLMPAQFKMGTDRVVLSITAEQAKTQPTVKK